MRFATDLAVRKKVGPAATTAGEEPLDQQFITDLGRQAARGLRAALRSRS
jgi:hypothetical protein